MSGMKKMPLRADDVIDASTPLPVACSIMFVRIDDASSGSTAACQRSATAPMAMTSGSSRNQPTIGRAAKKQTAPATVIKMVPYFTQ